MELSYLCPNTDQNYIIIQMIRTDQCSMHNIIFSCSCMLPLFLITEMPFLVVMIFSRNYIYCLPIYNDNTNQQVLMLTNNV